MERGESKRRWTIALPFIVCALLFSMCACSESDSEEDEYANWQERNDEYFAGILSDARQKIASGDSSWRVIKNFSKDASTEGVAGDYIVAEVLSSGAGTACPLYTDTCGTVYELRLMPTASYPQGYMVEKTFVGDYNPDTVLPTSSSEFLPSRVVDGFATALMNMHAGDRWRVYIPYQLGYNATAKTGIPAYSTLIYDLTLKGFTSSGTPLPEWKARQFSFED